MCIQKMPGVRSIAMISVRTTVLYSLPKKMGVRPPIYNFFIIYL